MGLAGLSVAWRVAHQRYGVPAWIGAAIGAMACAAFVLLTAAYAVKWVTAPDAVRAEAAHPVARNTFATFWVSLMLLPLVLAPVNLAVARALWMLGAIGMLLLAWSIVRTWLQGGQQITTAAPAWLLPAVGMLDLPLAVPALELPHLHWVTVFGLGAGLFFSALLFTLVVARIVFGEALPAAVQPSLMILVAPFSVGSTAYTVATARSDAFAAALYAIALCMLLALAGTMRSLAKCCPFRLGWWAISFPLAASASTALHFAALGPPLIADALACLLLASSSLVIGFLFVRTLHGIWQGELASLTS